MRKQTRKELLLQELELEEPMYTIWGTVIDDMLYFPSKEFFEIYQDTTKQNITIHFGKESWTPDEKERSITPYFVKL